MTNILLTMDQYEKPVVISLGEIEVFGQVVCSGGSGGFLCGAGC